MIMVNVGHIIDSSANKSNFASKTEVRLSINNIIHN
jgi:hypothetical protein